MGMKIWSKGCNFVKIFCQMVVLGMQRILWQKPFFFFLFFYGLEAEFWDGMKAKRVLFATWKPNFGLWHKSQNFVFSMKARFCRMRTKILFLAWKPGFVALEPKFCGMRADFCGVKAKFCFWRESQFLFYGMKAKILWHESWFL